MAQFPLSCQQCGCQWVPSLARPAGRCAPLANRPARAIGRWTTYVAHAVGAPPASRRRDRSAHPRTGANLRHLAIMSQLFDRPPPLPSQLMARRKGRSPRSEQLTPSPAIVLEPREPGYDASRWPHFGQDFARYEMLLSHHSPLRALRALPTAGSTAQQLLDRELVLPSSAICCESAAALGWNVSWFGALRSLAAPGEPTAPAFGLAAWLAYLPHRPPKMPYETWRQHVARWLCEDAVDSAWVWKQIARFMQRSGRYVLHAAVVRPGDFALWRNGSDDGRRNFTSITS